MRDSYLILDEYTRFLDKGNAPPPAILKIGVQACFEAGISGLHGLCGMGRPL
jgi:hypothetical protein